MKLLLAALILVALMLAGCKKGDAPSTGPDNNGGDPVAADPSACSAADDCVAVEVECCDACNGGEAVAVHRDQVDAVIAASPRGQGACGETACTEMACPEWVAACDAGTCTISRGSFE